ncbi:MAG: hypothetical protein QXG65_06360 [Thermoplasmata archaeon]
MDPELRSPAVLVQLTQALIAHELVHTYGASEREAADLLGVVPSTVSQYLSGKRLGDPLRRIAADRSARRIARASAQELLASDHPRELAADLVLGAAWALGGRRSVGPTGALERVAAAAPREAAMAPSLGAALTRRVSIEQAAVADCMRLAQRSRDELTRAIFRQIASDSLRHAEIVASLASHLDRGMTSTAATGVTPRDIRRLLQKERDAESSGRDAGLERASLGGVMGILWQSMEADERKHELLLRTLLESGFRGGRPARRTGGRAEPGPDQGRTRSSSR